MVSYLIIAFFSGVVLTGAGLTLKKSVEKTSNLAYLEQMYNSRIVNAIPKEETEGVVAGIQTEKERPVCDTEYILSEIKGSKSIINYLTEKGEDSSFGHRQVLAREMGITNYTGTSDNNLLLLAKLQGLRGCK